MEAQLQLLLGEVHSRLLQDSGGVGMDKSSDCPSLWTLDTIRRFGCMQKLRTRSPKKAEDPCSLSV